MEIMGSLVLRFLGLDSASCVLRSDVLLSGLLLLLLLCVCVCVLCVRVCCGLCVCV